MANEVAETQQTTQQDVKRADPVYLQAECDPSLKERVKEKSISSGFQTLSDCLRTIARDFVAGRIQYTGGIYVGQEKSSPN